MAITQTMDELIKEAVLLELGKKTYPSSVLPRKDNIQVSEDVPIGISARHLHISREHLDMIYGKGHELVVKKELMGGQFAAVERVTIVGANLRVIENVTILGPERSATQVEVSKTDARKLGLNAPIRESGDVKGSMPITIVGPKGAITLKEGCIVAMRHIHMSPKDAENFKVKDKQIVSVKTQEGSRKGILSNVMIRVHDTYSLEMHIDTDEANAFGINPKDKVQILK